MQSQYGVRVVDNISNSVAMHLIFQPTKIVPTMTTDHQTKPKKNDGDNQQRMIFFATGMNFV